MNITRRTRLLIGSAILFGVACFVTMQWAKAGLPSVSEDSRLCGSVEVTRAVAVVTNYSVLTTKPSQTPEATLNVDGTWTVDPVALLKVMVAIAPIMPSTISPRELGWRLLLAYPLLPKADLAHAEDVATHPAKYLCGA